MTTPAELRRKISIRRNVGKTLIALGLLAVAACIVALFIEVQIVGVGSTMFTNCGGLVDPIQNQGYGAVACSTTLAEHARFATVTGGLAIVAIVAGSVVLVRNPV